MITPKSSLMDSLLSSQLTLAEARKEHLTQMINSFDSVIQLIKTLAEENAVLRAKVLRLEAQNEEIQKTSRAEIDALKMEWDIRFSQLESRSKALERNFLEHGHDSKAQPTRYEGDSKTIIPRMMMSKKIIVTQNYKKFEAVFT